MFSNKERQCETCVTRAENERTMTDPLFTRPLDRRRFLG